MPLTRNTYQRNSSWNAPYTFSGKEKDAETGYGYFGARYYDSGLSICLSVDPMSDKYPSMSPYNYCANNPVMLVDPDGREIDWHPDGFGNLVADKGDNYETLCNYLSTIYGDIKNVPSGEMLGYKLQLAAFEGADITGLTLTSNNGTFDNLVGKFLVTKFNQDENWGVKGSCSPTTFNRVKLASEFVYGKNLLGDYDLKNPIYASWNGYPRKGIPLWGSPIVSFLGIGMTVEEQNFQNGLTPGAILGFQSNFERGGHSSIFLGYKEDGSGLIEWGHTGIFWRDYNDNSYYSKSLVRATNFK